ncbi:MAG: TRAP transporter small permease subunit [Gammaproteobacteria bacterium]|nr:TRAP transporter small permease subunit [Gammaproteobacteria bacterium]NIR98458.1 TRAP transporter small permease subunit [Gammaproteobacteria bacterium]NIT64446.1 TRAP transporter small permease subunit [Gammaproteobacteria bacterium]NIV21360.1 TRAP transporter small permease subunit [Gammaproteobacteria bacterium]NIY33026.1 TRAP transporter small permease subunit [Gammaproteobacteria bacterium]
MVLVQFLVVVLRYVFATGSIALQESITYMHALVFMLGAGYTLKHDGHVRVDIFYRNMRPRAAAWVDLLGTVLFLLPLFGFIVWISWGYVWRSWLNLEGSPEAGGLPLVFALKGIILAMPLLMLAQGAAMAARSVLVLLGRGSRPAQHDEVEV